MGANLVRGFIYKNNLPFLSFKALYTFQSLKMFILFRIIDPFTHYLFYATLASALIGSQYLQYVVVGNIAYYTCQTVITTYMKMFRFEKRYATLELNITSPTKMLTIILMRSLVPFFDGLFVFLIGLAMGHLFFGLSCPLDNIVVLLVVVVSILLSVICFSLLFASISLIFSNVNLVLNMLLGILQVICGVNFSVNLLPSKMEFISRFLPLTHGIEALRTIYNMESFSLYTLIMKEISVGLFYLLLALIAISFMEKLARKNGALMSNI